MQALTQAYIRPQACLHPAWLDHTYMMRIQTSTRPHAHTQTSTLRHVAMHTYHSPASQSVPWFPPELRAKIRTRELKIHYSRAGGDTEGGWLRGGQWGREIKKESMLNSEGKERDLMKGWGEGVRLRVGESRGGKGKRRGVGSSTRWDIQYISLLTAVYVRAWVMFLKPVEEKSHYILSSWMGLFLK